MIEASYRPPSLLARSRHRAGVYSRSLGKLGIPATVSLLRAHLARVLSRGRASAPAEPRSIRLKGYPHPFYFRPGTSDLFVIQQIFLGEEYLCVARERDVRFILDCGANIGCASVYLLTKYPNARLVAIEPDAGNAEICRRNLAPFGDRARVIQAGIWPRDQGLVVERDGFRDGLEWSFHVRPSREGETAHIQAVGIDSLLRESPSNRVDLLKIDIEGAERQLFAEGVDDWISRIGTIAIELHGAECRDVFLGAIAPFEFALDEANELTIARRVI